MDEELELNEGGEPEDDQEFGEDLEFENDLEVEDFYQQLEAQGAYNPTYHGTQDN